ncbi:MAG: flagellar export chaperone FliS [Verrucomicrobia bacterium]|nr:flagellar export chaperone FliS [Verrucomicrobiota bacterium]
MPRSNSWLSYRQVATQTASPGQLILMLYDGALRFLERALLGFNSTDPLEFNQTINNNLIRAQAIINELNVSLDMERGGEFSDNMRRLYDYLDRRLQESNMLKTPDGIQEVVRRLTILREAWAKMLASQGHGATAGDIGARPVESGSVLSAQS